MAIFDSNSPGLLGKAGQWMTPERGMALAGLGQAFSQLGAGQPVDLSSAHAALQQRRERQQAQQALQSSGLMEKFSPEQRAILAQMEPSAAQKIIASVMFAPPPEPVKLQTFTGPDGTVYQFNPSTGAAEPITGAKPADPTKRAEIIGPAHPLRPELGLPDDGKSYEVIFEGDTPVDFSLPGGSGTVIQNNLGPTGVDYGDPGAGLVWKRDAEGNVMLDDRSAPIAIPFQGGKAWQEQQSAEQSIASQAGLAATSSDLVTKSAARARQAAKDRTFGGLIGQAAALNPESENAEVYRQVAALQAMAAVENITAMRKASPSGAALGQASDKDIQLLKDKSGALDPRSKNFQRDLDDYERTLLRIIHGNEVGDEVFEATRDSAPKVRVYNPETGKLE